MQGAAASQGITPGLDVDVTTLSPPPPAAEYGLTEVEETEAQKNARINNSMGMVPGVGSGGGSRKKYKKRNANRSKKNRRNKRRTNKRN